MASGLAILSSGLLAEEACHIHIAALNVENAFDPVADLSKDDDEFVAIQERPYVVPHDLSASWRRRLVNWDAQKLGIKVGQIARTIDIVSNYTFDGARPDIVALNEIENENILTRLTTALDFEHSFMTFSPDHRGIDNALLWNEAQGKLVAIARREHQLIGRDFDHRPSRNIIEVVFKVAGVYKLHVLVNHWPSQGGPTRLRLNAAKRSFRIAEDILDKNSEARVLMLGDFNTLESERPNPIQDELLRRDSRIQLIQVSQTVPFPKQPKGSYYYKPTEEWNQLDDAFGSANLAGSEGLHLRSQSFRVIDDKALSIPYRQRDGIVISIPWGYDFDAETPERAGFQDHYPLLFTLQTEDREEREALPADEFWLDGDVLNLETRVALFYKTSGRTRYFSQEEFEENREDIGREGTRFENLEFRNSPDGSMKLFEDSPNNRYNYLLRDLDNQLGESPTAWQGARWEEFREHLMDSDRAKSVIIRTDRRQRKESLYQALLYLQERGYILYLPSLDNIETKYWDFRDEIKTSAD